jgi:hypothetical protein
MERVEKMEGEYSKKKSTPGKRANPEYSLSLQVKT